MIKRIITGVLLIAFVVGMFCLRLIDIRLFNILTFGCAIVGTFEMVRAMGDRMNRLHKIIAMAFAVAVVPVYVFFGFKFMAILLFGTCTLLLFTLVFDFEKTTLENVGISMLCLFYPSMLLLPIMLINDMANYSLIALLLVFVIAPCSDTFAFFVGSTLKGPKLSPTISPKKTISGAIGGIIGGGVGAIIVWACVGQGKIFDSVGMQIFFYALVGVVTSAISEVGDLVEGAIKRKVGIKDMGKFLPGHGGLLDRIDAIIVSAMFIYLFFMILN